MSFLHAKTVSTCFSFSKESSSEEALLKTLLKLSRRPFTFDAHVDYFKCSWYHLIIKTRVCIFRTSLTNGNLSGRDSEVCTRGVHELCNEGDLEVLGARTETTHGEPNKSMSMMGIRDDRPPLNFWTRAESESFKITQIYSGRWRWWLMMLTYDAE